MSYNQSMFKKMPNMPRTASWGMIDNPFLSCVKPTVVMSTSSMDIEPDASSTIR